MLLDENHKDEGLRVHVGDGRPIQDGLGGVGFVWLLLV